MADDYCMVAVLQARGFWGAQKLWYDVSTGSVAFNFVATVAALLPPQVVSYWPALALVLWWGALLWAIWQMRLVAQPAQRAIGSGLLAGVVLLVTLDTSPHLFQSFFWLDGALRYLAPQIFITLYIGLVAYSQRRTLSKAGWWTAIAGSVALTFIAGTFSETHMALQVGLTAMAMAVCLFAVPAATRRRLLPWLAAGLAGTLLAFAVTILAPGTLARKLIFGPPPGPFTVLSLTWKFSWNFLQLNLERAPLGLLMAAALPMVLAWQFGETSNLDNPEARGTWRRVAVRLGLLAGVTLVAIFFSLAPAAWALTFSPPARALLVPQFALVGALACSGYLVGCAIRITADSHAASRPYRAGQSLLMIVACLAVLYPVRTAWRVMRWHPVVSAQAAAWDDFHAQMRKAKRNGLTAISLPAPDNNAGLETIGPDPKHWVNGCASAFYGVTVTGYPPPRALDDVLLSQMTRLQANLGNVAQLQGYRVDKELLRPGETLSVTVEWLPLAHTDRPYTVFIHLYDVNHGSIAQQDTYPLNGAYATTAWIPGRPFLDTYQLAVPANAPVLSQAKVVVGLYDRTTMTRLPVSGPDAGPVSNNWVEFGRIRVISLR